MKMQKTRIYTMADARDKKRNADLPALVKIQQLQEIENILSANPKIGVLQTARGRRFYVNFPVYLEAEHPARLIMEG